MKTPNTINSKITATLLITCILFFQVIISGNAQNLSPDYAFNKNEQLGIGGNLGNILYNFEVWEEIGLKNVRINIGPFDHADKKPPYTLSEDFIERLDWTVNQALERGLTVIIDNHEYHAMADDPMGYKEMFLATWKQLAEHYQDYPDKDSAMFAIKTG